jgi:hypothetical protein
MKVYDTTSKPTPDREPISVYPAIAAQRDDAFVPGTWVIEEGAAARGGASCDVNNRVLQVPRANTQAARLVRAHELTHARVSPVGDVLERAWAMGVHPRALSCAEEARVNYLIAKAGFDVEHLADGTEKESGTMVAVAGDWAEALCFAVAIVNTGSEKPYLSGIRQGNKDWVAPMRAVLKRVNEILTENPVAYVASTKPTADGMPEGFTNITLPIARLLSTYMSAEVPVSRDELSRFKRGMDPGGRRPPAGVFAPLVWLDQPEFDRVNLRGDVRRARPSNAGVAMRYPSRALTDPHRRVMAKKTRVGGGIVLIDQSGSMDMEPEEVREFARTHPKALLVGYSHRPGDPGGTANVWILAANGKVASAPIAGNVGNGVDGPILEWAIAQRRSSEPIVWVCDGQVTDAHDHPGPQLTAECGELVARHKIRLVRNLAAVSAALAHPRGLVPSEYPEYGRIGRYLATRSR